ncbi:MAG: hypothetical protein D6812_16230 [Deltaproteobacteria bacterium]|nr:MAG: hypothetical protein D6812_16230 [Deltaproteobacteria bacterium]
MNVIEMKNLSLCLSLCLLLSACATSDEARIDKLLQSMEKGIDRADLETFLECYDRKSPRFPEIEAMTRHVFTRWEKVDLTISERAIYVTGNEARVVVNFFIEGHIDGKRKSYPGKRSLQLVRQGNRWRIAEGFLLEPLYSFSSPEKARIREVMERRAEALRRKDLERYLSCFSPNYHDPVRKTDFSQIKAEIIERFRKWEKIDFRITKIEITIRGKSAIVDESFQLSGIIHGKEMTFPPGRELFHLEKDEEGRWRIVRGL